jgi:glycosyltransferase involved in cell wall biosynthesis
MGTEQYPALGGGQTTPPVDRPRARTLAGATTLQILPVLTEAPSVRAALAVSAALLRAGARSLVASGGGPLVSEVNAEGAEWVSFPNAHVNRWNVERAARALEDIINAEQIDIIHALGAGGGACALAVHKTARVPVVISLPDTQARRTWFDRRSFDPLGHGERIIVPSAYMAAPMIKHHGIPQDRVVVIPRAIDLAQPDPATVRPDHIAGLHSVWRVRPGERVFMAPGPVTVGSGHLILVDAVRVLLNGGLRDAVFVIPRDDASDPKQVHAVAERAAAQGVDGLFRFSNPPADKPTLLRAADIVVAPATEPPTEGRIVIEAQALARPVIASDIGVLPENLLAPPRTAGDMCTGWLVRPDDPIDLACAIGVALTLDDGSMRGISSRARHFAEMTFSPPSVAAATLAVYTSVLGGG